jgi:hypothetical protein
LPATKIDADFTRSSARYFGACLAQKPNACAP